MGKSTRCSNINTRKFTLSSFTPLQYTMAVVDYFWVIIVYVLFGFVLAILLDGNVFQKFDLEKEEQESSIYLFFKILMQLGVQGFIAILLILLLKELPSPVKGIYGYHTETTLGNIIRNPALISVMLFSLSKSLQSRLLLLRSRFATNSLEEPYPANIL